MDDKGCDHDGKQTVIDTSPLEFSKWVIHSATPCVNFFVVSTSKNQVK